MRRVATGELEKRLRNCATGQSSTTVAEWAAATAAMEGSVSRGSLSVRRTNPRRLLRRVGARRADDDEVGVSAAGAAPGGGAAFSIFRSACSQTVEK